MYQNHLFELLYWHVDMPHLAAALTDAACRPGIVHDEVVSPVCYVLSVGGVACMHTQVAVAVQLLAFGAAYGMIMRDLAQSTTVRAAAADTSR